MDGKLLFCVSVGQGDNLLYGPEWKEAERGISLVDLFLQVCGSKVLGQQVQVLVSRDREFLEGAVVQVCSPLSHLAERSQSYIKFIIKGEHPLPKNAFVTPFASERDPNNSNYKPPQERITSLCMNDPLMTEKWLIKSDTAMLHTLATKPTFENMTVEEICDEIRSIRKTEMSKNKLTGWIGDEKKHSSNEPKNNANSIIKEIDKEDQLDLPRTPEKPKKSPVPKTSLPKSSPLPPKKKTDVKRSTSFRSNKSFKRLSENTRNKLNGKKHADNRNKDKDKTLPSKNSKTVNNNAKNISERLSILAQPRKRHSEPNIVTSPTLQSSTHSVYSTKNSSISKRSMEIKSSLDRKSTSMERLNRKSRDSTANSTFIKGCDNNEKTHGSGACANKKNAQKPKGKKKPDPNEQYFIEIYAKDKPENQSEETHKNIISNGNSDGEELHKNITSDGNSRNDCANSSKIGTIREPSKNNSKHTDKSRNSISEKNASITSNTSRNNSSKEFSKDSLVSYNDSNDSKSRSIPAEYVCDDFIPQCISPVKGGSEKYVCGSPLKQNMSRSYNTDYSSSLYSTNRVMSVDNLLASINAETDRTKRSRHDSLSIDDKNTKNDKLLVTSFQSSGNETKSMEKLDHKSNELVGVGKFEKDIREDIANLSREILHNSGGNTSIENILDTYLLPSPTKVATNLVPSPTKTATKSPLFTQLLEKNNLKHSSTRSTDSSLDDVIDTPNDSKESVSTRYIEHESHIPSKSGFVIPIRETEKKHNITSNKNSSSYTNDNEHDKFSKIPVNNRKLSPQKSRMDEADKMWANSRGIKFMKDGLDRRQPLMLTDLECEDKSAATTSSPSKSSLGDSQLDKSQNNKSPVKKSLNIKIAKLPENERCFMHLPLTLFHSVPSASTPTSSLKGIMSPTVRTPTKTSSRTSTPDRNRKLWGNSIDGMDTMLIPSLQAFSLELRTLSETVTSNLTALYENFQRRYGGLDIGALDGSKRAFTPTSPRPTENGGDQQGVAIVFRNLRKIEGQMRTIEHATLTMLNVLDEKTNSQGNIPAEKVEGVEKVDLNAMRKVSWGELKNVPGTSSSNLTYWLSDKESTKESNTESVN